MADFNDDLGKTDLQKLIDDESKNKAVQIEENTRQKTKEARMKLEEAALKQKGTTDKVRMMNENLEDAKLSGIKTYENANEAKRQANVLTAEKNAFDPFSNLKAKYSNWAEKDNKADEEIQEIKDRKKAGYDVAEDSQGSTAAGFGEGAFEAEKQTNDELAKILSTVKGITKETDVQKKEGEKQTTNLHDILKTSENAMKVTEDANKKLEDFNKDD